MLADLAHLDLFGTFGDAIATMVSVNVFEGHVSAVPDSSTGLHRAIGGVATQSIGAVIAHRDEVRELHEALDVGTIGLYRIEIGRAHV